MKKASISNHVTPHDAAQTTSVLSGDKVLVTKKDRGEEGWDPSCKYKFLIKLKLENKFSNFISKFILT